ncbi:DUF6079 family protein [Vibrio parahaemolyticus]|uniref:DUF6079 family protein n=1 Tax=Vibrio parahaemolyticus TaxID=670 RepID=UPI001C55D7DB|nr:DUF6079 family protein [Vibrio parahaemolyticus]
MLWGNHVLAENEAILLADRLGKTKTFLESLQRFNTPGKLKNFKESAESIAEHAETLKEWKSFKQLSEVVDSFAEYAQYLKEAQLILDENDEWQSDVRDAALALRNGIEDKTTRLESSLSKRS